MPRRILPIPHASGEANTARGARFRDRRLTRYAVSWHPPVVLWPLEVSSGVFRESELNTKVRTSRERRKHAMLAHRLNSLQQIAGGIRFHNVPSCSCIEGFTHHLRRVMLGDEQNFKTSLPL